MQKSISLNWGWVVVLDILGIAFMYFVPTLSHLTAIPFYKLEPMRIVILINLLLLADMRNAYFMALTLPLFSFLAGSHPMLLKVVIMSVELCVNIFLFSLLAEKMRNTGIAMFIAIFGSKTIYYILKFSLISTGVWAGSVVDTNLGIQLIVAVGLSLLFRNAKKYNVVPSLRG